MFWKIAKVWLVTSLATAGVLLVMLSMTAIAQFLLGKVMGLAVMSGCIYMQGRLIVNMVGEALLATRILKQAYELPQEGDAPEEPPEPVTGITLTVPAAVLSEREQRQRREKLSQWLEESEGFWAAGVEAQADETPASEDRIQVGALTYQKVRLQTGGFAVVAWPTQN